MTVKADCAAVYIIKTHQKFDHSGLSGACRSDNGNLLSRSHIYAEVVNDRLIRLVAEMNMLKRYRACHLGNITRILHGLVFFLLIQEFKHTLRSRRHRLHLVDDLCDLLDRLCETFHVLDKRLNISDCDRSPDSKQTSAKRNGCISEISDKHHDRLHHTGEKL